MSDLLAFRESLIGIYRRYESLFRYLVRFLSMLTAILFVDAATGYSESLSSPVLALALSLTGALLPMGLDLVLVMLLGIVQLYSLALEAAAVGGLLVLLMLLLYFRFSPEDGILMMMYPGLSTAGMQYILPVAGGLLYNPASAVTCSLAVVYTGFLKFCRNNAATIGDTSEESDTLTKFRFVVDGILQNREMQVMIAAVILTVAAVYLIRRLPIVHSWLIATAVGCVVQLMVILTGDMLYQTDINIGLTFLGVLAAAAAGVIMTFLLMNLDYSRIEKAQFEDKDYYYYVKAVPKNTYSRPRRTVKQINTSRHGCYRVSEEDYPPERDSYAGYREENARDYRYPADDAFEDVAPGPDRSEDDYGY